MLGKEKRAGQAPWGSQLLHENPHFQACQSWGNSSGGKLCTQQLLEE